MNEHWTTNINPEPIKENQKSVPDCDNELYSHQWQERHQLAMALQVACKHHGEDSDMIQNALWI